MPNWFQLYRRSSSRKKLQQHLEKDDDNNDDEVASETVMTTTMSSCDGGLTDSRISQQPRSASFCHRKRQQPPQPLPLHASSYHDKRNSHRREATKNRAVYIKTGNHLYNDIEYYEYTIPSFQRQGLQQPAISSSLPQQQQQMPTSPPSSPMAVSSLGSSLSSVHSSSSYTDASVTAKGIRIYRDDDNKRSNRILSEFAMSAYLTADCS